MDGGNGTAGATGENHWAGLSNVAGTARAIDGEGDVLSCFDLAAHGKQSLHRAARRTSLRSAEAEAFDDPAGPLTIEIHGVQHHDAAIAPDPGGGEDAAMPNRANPRFAGVANLDGVADADHFDAQGRTDNPNDPVHGPGDDRNLHATPTRKLRQRDFRWRIGDGAAGRWGRFRVSIHCAIV